MSTAREWVGAFGLLVLAALPKRCGVGSVRTGEPGRRTVADNPAESEQRPSLQAGDATPGRPPSL